MEQSKAQGPANLIGGAVGLAAGLYCGINLVIPIVFAFVALKVLKSRPASALDPFKLAAATVIGHTLWICLGLLTPARFQLLPDLVLFAGGLVWLFLAPGPGVAWYFVILEAIEGVINVYSLSKMPVGTFQHKALVAHIFLRVAAIVLLYGAVKKRQASPGAPPPLPEGSLNT